MKIPEPKNTLQALIDAHHEQQAEKPRSHLGCSVLGHPCDRWLWLSFRWAVQEQFAGRILRLFRRGQLEEAPLISDLRAIGMDVRIASSGKQQRVDFGSHISGSLDAVIESGVPEAPKKKHVAEFKTHSLKSFNELAKDGVEKSKPPHFAQMQLYMHGTGIDRALYVAVCKDDDRIYAERVRYDKALAEKYLARGQRIALDDRMPPPLSTDPSWYQCKLCPAWSFCHEKQLTQHVNCRTCAHSTALPDSTWHCARYDASDIPVEYQREGCDCHVLHPDLVPWQLDTDASSKTDATWIIDGKRIRNGEGDAYVYTSRELLANLSACLNADNTIEELRDIFDARIVG